MFKSISEKWLKLCVCMFMACVAIIEDALLELSTAFGVDTLGSRAQSIQTEIGQFKNLAIWVGILLGVVFFIIGIIKLTKRSGGEDGPGKAVMYMIAGALLAGLSTIIGITSQTLLATEPSNVGLGK